MERVISLREVTTIAPTILDTSALINYESNQRGRSCKERESAKLYLTHLRTGFGLYLPIEVVREYLGGGGIKYQEDYNFALTLLGERRGISLSPKEKILYSRLLNRFNNSDRTQNLRRLHKIGKMDLHILLLSLIVSQRDAGACFITRDHPLIDSWRTIIANMDNSEDRFRCFERKGFDVFEMQDPHKKE